MSDSPALLSDIALGHSLFLTLSVWLMGRMLGEALQLQSAESPWNLAKPLPELVEDTQLYTIPHSTLAPNVTTVHSVQGLILGTKLGRSRAMPRCVCMCLPVHYWCSKENTNKNGTLRCQLISTRHTQSTKAHLNFGCHPGHLLPSLSLSQHVRPDAKGNIVEGRGSPIQWEIHNLP